jgi:SagB-type dehydrogenase family enzyme
VKIRRHEQLLCRWLPTGLEIAVPGRKAWLALSEDLRRLLQVVGDGSDTEDLLAPFGNGDRAQLSTAIDALLTLGVLARADAPVEQTPVLWRRWGQVTRRFHVESRDGYLPIGSPRTAGVVEKIAEHDDAPPGYKEYRDRPVVELPRQLVPLTMSMDDAFSARRTHRTFVDAPLSAAQLGTVLFHTFAPYRMIDAGLFGILQSRVSPAAGARHEVEAYVVVFDVLGVAPGLYHYNPKRHVLELLNDHVPRARIAELSYHQPASYRAPVTILTTAVASRLSWKYRHPRAYRLWMYDAGHYGQTFALTATAMGLGPFQTVMFNDTEVERLLEVDADEEFAVYLFTAGVPAGTGPAGHEGQPAEDTRFELVRV